MAPNYLCRNVVIVADLVQALYVRCLTVAEYTITPVQWLQGLFRLVLLLGTSNKTAQSLKVVAVEFC